jgi:predicted RNase H-like HicB family nuclease
MREALTSYVEFLREEGRDVPEPMHRIEYIAV